MASDFDYDQYYQDIIDEGDEAKVTVAVAQIARLAKRLEVVEREAWHQMARCRHLHEPYQYNGKTYIDHCDKTQWTLRGDPTHEVGHKFDPPPFRLSVMLATARGEKGRRMSKIHRWQPTGRTPCGRTIATVKTTVGRYLSDGVTCRVCETAHTRALVAAGKDA